jgi:TonB family protein
MDTRKAITLALLVGCWLGTAPAARAQSDQDRPVSVVWTTVPPLANHPDELRTGSVAPRSSVTLTCRVNGALLSECAPTQGVPAEYARLAIEAAGGARVAPQDGEGRPVEGAVVEVQIRFPLSGVRWLEQPEGRDYVRHYPNRALNNRIQGNATFECAVGIDGRLTSCIILSETPVGYGFGEATLAISREFRLAPQTSDGTPTEGARVRRTIRWRVY